MTQISRMTQKVIELVHEGASFQRAFANASREFGISQEDKGAYSDCLYQVRGQVIAEQVLELVSQHFDFNASFAKVAHQFGIWHCTNPEGYNAIFRQVLRKVTRKIGKAALSQSGRNAPSRSSVTTALLDFEQPAKSDME